MAGAVQKGHSCSRPRTSSIYQSSCAREEAISTVNDPILQPYHDDRFIVVHIHFNRRGLINDYLAID